LFFFLPAKKVQVFPRLAMFLCEICLTIDSIDRFFDMKTFIKKWLTEFSLQISFVVE